MTVKAMSGASLSEVEWLMFIGRDFPSVQDAAEFGEAFRGHLRLASVVAKFPLDLGDGQVVDVAPEIVTDEAAARGPQLLHAVHGLGVFEQTDDDRFVSASSGRFSSALPVRLLDDALATVEQQFNPVAEGTHLALACDLRAVYMFDRSPRSRFVTLVTALEALEGHARPDDGAPGPASDRVAEIVGGWLNDLSHETGVDEKELQSLRSRVGLLKRQSIAGSIRSLVQSFAPGAEDDPNDEFVAGCYELRSRLVHGNADVPDVSQLCGRLAAVVDELILAQAADR